MISSSSDHLRSRAGWTALRVLLALEGLLLVWVLAMTVLGALGSSGAVVQNLSLVVMAAISLLWVIVTCVGAARSRAGWVRGSSLTIHVLLFAAGTGCLQIGIGPWWLGFALAALAIVGFAAALLALPDNRTAAEKAAAAE